MNDNIRTEDNVTTRPPIQKWAIVGIVLFFIVGFFLSAPCLCHQGAAKGSYKTIFYIIVLIRLLYGLFKRNLQLVDYLLWVIPFVVFCIVVEII